MIPAPTSLAPLVDGFGRVHTYLRLAVTERCNLRCRYCMPPEGVPVVPRDHLLRFEEIGRLAGLLARMGVTKIRLTGGEPTVRRDLERLIAMLAATPGIGDVALTTNGLNLAERLPAYRAAGLRHVNISLDTLRPDRFERIALRPGLERVLAGVDAALAEGYAPVRLNVVVMGGVNDDELTDFVQLTRERPLHVRFIEYMPFAGNRWHLAQCVPAAEMRRRIEAVHPLQPVAGADPHAVARDFTIPGFCGRIGFITSMSDHFCSGCNRIRLTADGALRACLFQAQETSLRDALRAGADDDALAGLIRATLSGKWREHPPAGELLQTPNRAMTRIGG